MQTSSPIHSFVFPDLYFLGAFWSAADIAVRHRDEVWEAVTAGFVHEVPCKDSGVVLVQPVVDGVASVHHGVNVVSEELLSSSVRKEYIVTLGSSPLDVLHRSRIIGNNIKDNRNLVILCHEA